MTETATTSATATLTGLYYSPKLAAWHPKLFAAIAGRALWAVAETRDGCERLARQKYQLSSEEYEIVEITATIPTPGSSLPDPVWPRKKTWIQELYDEMTASVPDEVGESITPEDRE